MRHWNNENQTARPERPRRLRINVFEEETVLFLPLHFIIPVQEGMHLIALFVGNDRVQVHVFHAAEDVGLHGGIASFSARAMSCLISMRLDTVRPVGVAGGAGVGEVAGALDKVQIVAVAPRLDIRLADQIHAGGSAPCPGKFVLWSFGIMV